MGWLEVCIIETIANMWIEPSSPFLRRFVAFYGPSRFGNPLLSDSQSQYSHF